MSTKHSIPVSISLLALSISQVSQAAIPINLSSETSESLSQDFQMISANGPAKLSMDAEALEIGKQRIDDNKVQHTRVQQVYQGYPVLGGAEVIHRDVSNEGVIGVRSEDNTTMNGKIYKGLQNDLGPIPTDYEVNAKKVLEQFKQPYNKENLSNETIERIIYIDKSNQAHWAYKVSVQVNHKKSIPSRPTAIINADNSKPFVSWNDIKTLSKAIGLGFGGNHKTQKYEFGKNKPLLHILRDTDNNVCYMENHAVKVVDMKKQYGGVNQPMKFDCPFPATGRKDAYWTGYNRDGYDIENGAYSPVNDALFAGQIIQSMYKGWFGVDALTEQGRLKKMVMRVHYGTGYENAFWDGEQMTFDDGRDFMHPLVSLGVGAHEISHGFTEQHSSLIYYGQSGGINEAFSDMAAQAAEYYTLKKSSWTIGSEIMKESSGMEALRYMERPSRDGRSIDHTSDYYQGLDVHHSSGVYNRLFYLLSL